LWQLPKDTDLGGLPSAVTRMSEVSMFNAAERCTAASLIVELQISVGIFAFVVFNGARANFQNSK
jgi:hypothetical protein